MSVGNGTTQEQEQKYQKTTNAGRKKSTECKQSESARKTQEQHINREDHIYCS